MREIKCRAKVKWNGNHFFAGDWVEGFYAYKELTDEHVILVERANMNRLGFNFIEVEVIPETVGQYTGLKDRNGKEIYEGDVLDHPMQGKRIVYYPFNERVASYGLREISTGMSSTLQDSHRVYEIIGNIHENPELLEVQYDHNS